MKKILLGFIVLITGSNLYAQESNYYYWYKDRQKFLQLHPDKAYLVLEGINDTLTLKQHLNIPGAKIIYFDSTEVAAGLNIHHKITDPHQKQIFAIVESEGIVDSALTDSDSILYQMPFFISAEEHEIGISDFFYVKLNQMGDMGLLEQLADSHNITVLGNNAFLSHWFTLSTTKNSTGNALAMANWFAETGLFAAAEPDVMVDKIAGCVNDSLFENQWGLDHTNFLGE